MTSTKSQSHFMLILVCLLCDVFVRPFYSNKQFDARTSIIGAIIAFCICAVAVVIFLKLSIWLSSPFLKICLLLLFFSTSAATIVKAEQFYRFVSDKKLPLIVFVIVFVSIIIYSSKMPHNALARASVAVALLCLLTVGLIIISNFSDMDFQKLSVDFNTDISKSVIYHINFSAEILLFYVIMSKSSDKCNSFILAIFVVLAIYSVLTILSEAVMGNAAMLQAQTFNTLSRIGAISVFKRLDSAYSAIWVLAMLVKSITFYVYGFQLLQNKSVGKQISCVMLLIALIGVAYISTYDAFSLVLNMVTLALALIICIISLIEKRRLNAQSC